MMIRPIFAAFTIATLGFACAVTAATQSTADVNHIVQAVELQMMAIDTARKDLGHIEYEWDTAEARAVREIMEGDSIVTSAAAEVLAVGTVLRGLKSPDDLRFAQQQFALKAKLLYYKADFEVGVINARLSDKSTPLQPAALTETIKSRNLIVELRKILGSFAKPP